ncbi:MAG: hypothetical protein LUE23_03395 [Lachnospiraceae bacterium]|nr:hypothetical protein [Lachnospiraceae bacterium]
MPRGGGGPGGGGPGGGFGGPGGGFGGPGPHGGFGGPGGPPPPRRGWGWGYRRGGCCLPGCLMTVLGAGGLIALLVAGIMALL